MKTFAQKQNQPQKPESSDVTRSHTATLGLHHRAASILLLQRTIGNQAVQHMLQAHVEELKVRLTDTTSPRFAHDYSQLPIHPSATRVLQTKSGIKRPGDEYEQKADRIAEQVMRMPEPQVQRQSSAWDPRYGTPRARAGNLKYEDYKARIGRPGRAETYAPELKDASDWGGKKVDPVRLTLGELEQIMKPEIPMNASSSLKEKATQAHNKRMADSLPHINDAFETMGINTVKTQALYLAHAAGETGTLSHLTEKPNTETHRYAPFIGRGPLHTTWEYGYVQALAYLETKKEQLEQVALTKEREANNLKQQVSPKGENYALAALALAEAQSARKKADLAQEAFQAIQDNLEEAANPKYAFIFGAAYMHSSGMVKRSKRLGDTASFAGKGVENVGMTGGASSTSMSNRAKIKNVTFKEAIDVLSKKAVDYKPDYLR